MNEKAHQELIHKYLQALSDGKTGDALDEFFTRDAVQIEFPNKFNPKGGKSDLETLKRRSEEGKAMLQKQTYLLKSELYRDNQAAIEALWEGVLAVPFLGLGKGDKMIAHFGMFFNFENGRIAIARNYDCIDSWE